MGPAGANSVTRAFTELRQLIVCGHLPPGSWIAEHVPDAGSILNLFRWVSVRTVKETFVPPKCYRYPLMDGE